MSSKTSDLQANNSDAADVRVVLETHRNQTVRLRVPPARGRRMQSRAVILLQDACHDIFEILAELG